MNFSLKSMKDSRWWVSMATASRLDAKLVLRVKNVIKTWKEIDC